VISGYFDHFTCWRAIWEDEHDSLPEAFHQAGAAHFPPFYNTYLGAGFHSGAPCGIAGILADVSLGLWRIYSIMAFRIPRDGSRCTTWSLESVEEQFYLRPRQLALELPMAARARIALWSDSGDAAGVVDAFFKVQPIWPRERRAWIKMA